MVCLRSGINRLRVRSTEQASIAHSASGPTASLSAAIALATSAQARAGAGYLAGKLARLLARNVSSLVPPEGVPTWQLLLSAAYKPKEEAKEEEEKEKEEPQPAEEPKPEDEDEKQAPPQEDVSFTVIGFFALSINYPL